MPLTDISIKHLRCFDQVKISLSPGINFFMAQNGSGKTSLLEAVFIFSSGKSFKSSNLQSLIKYDKKNFYLKGFDRSSGHIIEVEKHINRPVSLKLNNKKIVSSKLIKSFLARPFITTPFHLQVRHQILEESY